MFHHGKWEEAVEALKQLTQRRPADGAALHNLGVLYARGTNLEAAVDCFTLSLQVRPESAPTLFALGEAHRQLGDIPAARSCFDGVLQIEADNEAAKTQLLLLSGAD